MTPKQPCSQCGCDPEIETLREALASARSEVADAQLTLDLLRSCGGPDSVVPCGTCVACLRSDVVKAEARLGPVPDGCHVLAYVSWEDAQEMHALAQPLVDHIEAGKLAKRVVDFLRPGAALAAPLEEGRTKS